MKKSDLMRSRWCCSRCKRRWILRKNSWNQTW